MKEMYQDVFRLGNFSSGQSAYGYGPAGSMHVFDDGRGRGEYWTYSHGDMFAVNAFEMAFEERGALCCSHAEHLSICLYEDVHDVETRSFQMKPGAVLAYIAEEGGEFAARYGCGARMKGMSITVSPSYYRDYLEGRFGPIPDVRQAFAKLDGREDFPEMASLLRRIRGYRGSGMAASLFYEGAVAEAIGLVVGHAAGADVDASRLTPSDNDPGELDVLGAYLGDHLSQQMSVEMMARLACMGLTKFKLAFSAMGAPPPPTSTLCAWRGPANCSRPPTCPSPPWRSKSATAARALSRSRSGGPRASFRALIEIAIDNKPAVLAGPCPWMVLVPWREMPARRNVEAGRVPRATLVP